MATKPVQSLSADEQIEAFYVAFYGAAADSEGFAKWQAKFAKLLAHESVSAALGKIGDLIGDSAETKAAFPLLRHMPLNPHSAIEKAEAKAMVDTIYQNLFGVAPPAGDTALNKLANEFLKGTETIADVVLLIANGATGANLAAFENKVAVATDFTAATTAAGFGFPPSAAYLAEAKLVVADTTSDPTTVTTEESAINAWIAAGGGAPGQTYNLTPGIDNIDITTVGTYDTVKGIIDQKAGATDTTFTVGDTITGNGHTTVDIAVESLATNDAAQLVTMSGVSTVNILQGQASTLEVNAGTWGSVNNINVSGFDGSVSIEHLNVTNGGGLSLNIATTGTADIIAKTGKVSGLSYYADVGQANGVGSVAKFGTAGIDATIGKGGYLDLSLWQSVDHHNAASGAASVGNISIAHVNVNLGQSADGYVSIWNSAEARSNNATVGNLTVGDVNFTIAQKGDADDNYIGQYAYVTDGKGDAQVGNLTIGNVTVNETGKTGDFYAGIYNEAYAHTGNATVGNLTLGNVSLMGNDYAYAYVYNEAGVYDAGNASAGNLTLGNVALVDGTASYHELYVYNDAYADGVGNAQVGNVSVGAVNMTAGYENYFYVYNEAGVDRSGSATAGNIALGNVTVNAKSDAYNYLWASNEAYVDNGGGAGGAATAGNVTIGAVSMAAASGYNEVGEENYVWQYGSKSHAATVGNTTVGNVTMIHNADATGHSGGYNELYVEQYAYAETAGNATVGNISIGNVSINPAGVGLTGQTNAENYIEAYNYAYAGGAHGVATVGAITIGNVTAATGASGYVDVYAYNYADGKSSADKAGLVTIGNVSMKGAGNADMYVSAYDYAVSGTATGITIGSVSLAGTKGSGYAALDAKASGDITGQVKVGNVAITDQYVGLHVSNYAKTGAAGGITVGNITLKGANDGGANSVWESAAAGTTGNIAVGNVSLSVGHGQELTLNVENLSPAGKAGTVTLGNINLAIANTNATTKGATAALHVSTTGTKGGSITAGNITIGSSGVTTKAALATAHMAGHVTITSAEGSVTVGNITVTGGVLTDTGTVDSDNLGAIGPTSAWLDLSAPNGTVTVGNIDYSGYASAAVINVQGYTGAGSIVGSQGGSTITDNSGVNAINVSHTTAADTIYLQGTDASAATSQAGVVDNGTTITASQSALDSITGIHSGDSIGFSDGSGGLGTMGGNGDLVQAGSVSFSAFLANAETQIDHDGNSVYTANISGNTYVAMANTSGHVGEIVEVTGVHTFTLTGGELHYLS